MFWRHRSLLLLGMLLSGCTMTVIPTPPALPTPIRPPEIGSTAEALQAAVVGDFPLDAVTIEYRVGIEAWGGATSLLARGPGSVEVVYSLVGEHTTWTSTLTDDEFLDLCRLMVEHRIWAIRGERETGIPDEARPNVTITAEGFEPVTIGMWDGEAAEHPDFGPIVRELDWLVYQIQTGAPR
jgi:hypothetical protein